MSAIAVWAAGACIVAAAIVNRGLWRFEERPGRQWTEQPPFRRACAVFIGCIWASVGVLSLVA
jgi:hypothetical protein